MLSPEDEDRCSSLELEGVLDLLVGDGDLEHVAGLVLVLIEDKTKVAGGKLQINLHDGRNILIDKNEYKTGDVLKISVPDQKIEDVYELKAGATVLIFRGQHAGKTAVVEEYIVTKDSSENVVRFKDGSETVKSNVFVIGNETAAIKLPEASA